MSGSSPVIIAPIVEAGELAALADYYRNRCLVLAQKLAEVGAERDALRREVEEFRAGKPAKEEVNDG